MKALCWYGKEDVRVETVADPVIEDPHDIIVKITATAICGSDLHLYNGLMPTMEKALKPQRRIRLSRAEERRLAV